MPEQTIDEMVSLSGESLVKQLREVVSPPGKKGNWLKHLSDKRLLEVYHRLRIGQSSSHIAKVVQIEWGIQKLSPVKSLARAITLLRKKVIGEIFQGEDRKNKERKKLSSLAGKRGNKLSEQLDAMAIKIELIHLQYDRVKDLRTKEKASMPFKFTGREVVALDNMLSEFLNMEIKLGLRDSKPSEYNVLMKYQFDGLIGRFQDGGQKMLDVSQKFLEAAEKEALTLEVDDNGVATLKNLKRLTESETQRVDGESDND